nr:N-acylethanolamine-hydrolyzing acid amidase-like [Lytechinus pictus]
MAQLGSVEFAFFAFCALILTAVSAGAGSRLPAQSLPVPRLCVNLDSPAEERWGPALHHWNLTQMRTLFIGTIEQVVPKEALPLVDQLGNVLDELLPAPYSGEIRGVAKTLDIGVGEMAFINMLYDFTAACTSIVAQDANGTIWHGRNLDYSFSTSLSNVTAIVDFKSHGKTVYTTTSFVGQVGVFTGMKPNKFTISLNERDQGSVFENVVELLKAILLKKVKFTTFVLRDALTNDNSFDEVVQRFTSQKEVSPVYLIIGGIKPGEGVVVTRGRETTLDVWRLDLSGNRWFLLETNYDHWVPPPKSDDRRDPGNKAMNAVGEKSINNNTMWNVLSTQPVLNEDTIYTALMCAARPEIYSSRLRKLPDN